MAITRIKNNQITDGTITGTKLVSSTITGGLLENDMTYGSNLTVTGNLTVSGTSTTIDTTAMTVEDPIMVLASNQSGAGATDIGFIGERGTNTNIAFVWDESADKFVAATTSDADSSTTVTVSAYADMQVKDLALEDLVASADGSFGGTLGVTGVTTLANLLNANGGIAVDTNNFTVDGSSGAVSTASTLNADGATTLGSTLGVTGASTVAAITASGLATLNGGIVVDTNKFTVADATGNTVIDGTLDVNGATTISSLDASGVGDFADTLTLSKATGTGLSVTADATVGGTLAVTGCYYIN